MTSENTARFTLGRRTNVGKSRDARVEPIVEELTVEEKVALLSGRDLWRTAEIERADIGSVKVTDGPNGARGDSTTGTTAVCLPASIGLGATFDRDLVAEAGALLGRETARKGAHVLLAPTINMARHPLGGRNFESFGEDPHLTAELAVAYVTGVQSEGVGACAKHFVANDVEFARMTVSSEVDETVLREVYLVPFEAVVEAGVWSVMASYPMLNGVHCTEHEWLLTDLLRGEWGFDGLVMSDWGATHHRSRPVLAGLDLEMPGPATALGPALLDAVTEGEVPIEVLDERAGRVVELAARAGRLGELEPEPERSIDLEDDRLLARRVATDSFVLLANDGVLPLTAPESDTGLSVCVIGPNAADAVIQGGGSAQVPAHRAVSAVEGLTDALGAEAVTHHRGCLAHRHLPPVTPESWAGPVRQEQFSDGELIGEPEVRSRPGIGAFAHGADTDGFAGRRWTGRLRVDETGSHTFGVLAVGRSRVLIDGTLVADNWTAPKPGDAFFQMASQEVVGEIDLEAGTEVEVVVEWSFGTDQMLLGLQFGHLPPVDGDALLEEAVVAAGAADVAVVVVGLTAEWETESHDRTMFSLPGRQDELVRRVSEVNDRTVVVINAGAPIDLPWIDEVAATLMVWYPGQELGHALADVLLGRAEPGGRLPLTWPRRLADTPFELPIPEPGPPRPGATLPYTEGLLIGHRAYDRNGIEPLAPFGFGLGYTDFDLGQPRLVPSAGGAVGEGAGAERGAGAEGDVEVVVAVANVGDRAGKCVVQAYVDAPEGADPARPLRVLGGFTAVQVDAGDVVEATVTVPARAFARWAGEAEGWVTDSGDRRLSVGRSSRDLTGSVVVTRSGSAR